MNPHSEDLWATKGETLAPSAHELRVASALKLNHPKKKTRPKEEKQRKEEDEE